MKARRGIAIANPDAFAQIDQRVGNFICIVVFLWL